MKKKFPKSKIVEHAQCPICLDTGMDNLGIREDGSSFCFKCWKTIDKSTDSASRDPTMTEHEPMIEGQVLDLLRTRALTEESCRKWDYRVGKYTGKLGHEYVKDAWVRICQYKNEAGQVVAQKIKNEHKKQKILGNAAARGLYGKWLWTPTDKLFITITEGEEDALAVSQAQSHQYPVVSLKNGAGGAREDVLADLDYLMAFKYVVLAFDNDEAGQKATQDVLPLLDYGKVRIADWPLKDANEMLLANRQEEIRNILWNAREYKPRHLVTMSDIMSDILKQPQFGRPFPWKSMTDITYGRQKGDLHIIVAAPSIGKTEFVKEIIFDDLEQGGKVGLFSFEQTPDNTARRLIGSKLNKKLHLPGSDWDEQAITEMANKYNDQIWFCNQTGSVSLQEVFNDIKYLAKAKQVGSFVIDNLASLGVSQDFEKATLLMTTLQSLKLELGVEIFLLSHVNKDAYQKQTYVSTSPKNKEAYDALTEDEINAMLNKDGMDWDSGRMPTVSNVDGPQIIVRLADYVWGLARNTVSDDQNKRRITKVKPLKTRLDSDKGGKTFKLFYTFDGRLVEEGGSSGYTDVNGAF